jgi:predicted metal-dependent hydrolase
MATKIIELDGIGHVTLVKRHGNRSIRLTVTPNGIRVSMPFWTPYSAGRAFAERHADWILREQAKQGGPRLENGQRIGKLHVLRFEYALSNQSTVSRVTGTQIVIKMDTSEAPDNPAVQERATKAAIRALKREGERLLPPRLANLAAKHSKQYHSVSIKQLKRRWGSCDSHQNIALNLFLMELPWDYIDYVLLHELTHTVEMNHGETFWQELTSMQPRARDLAKQLHNHRPAIGVWHV